MISLALAGHTTCSRRYHIRFWSYDKSMAVSVWRIHFFVGETRSIPSSKAGALRSIVMLWYVVSVYIINHGFSIWMYKAGKPHGADAFVERGTAGKFSYKEFFRRL